jgi:hypothetical protein
MSVNRYTIKIPSSGSTHTHIKLPVNLEYQIVDQGEVIERDFVAVEVENSINPILDYEKARFIPTDINGNQLYNVSYDLRFLSSSDMTVTNNWADIGMDDTDIKFRKNKWKKSHLKLNFYDSDKGTNQRLISFITIFPTLTKDDVYGLSAPAPLLPSTPKPAAEIPLVFRLQDPLTMPEGVAEGYYIYNYRDEVTSDLPKELFMRATFNNAKDGKTTNMSTVPTAEDIDVLVTKLYTKYVLKRNQTGYYYEIDDAQDNVTLANGGTSTSHLYIKLYEIQAN